jgi:RNA polymerase sigma factor (sigma-70 family)
MTTPVRTDLRDDALDQIVGQHAKFLSFVVSRVDVATAEDILQAAYIKAMEHGAEIRADESTVAWFYRILRNAITDDYRRRAARDRAHDGFAADAPLSYELELEQTACACIGDVLREIKSDYREAIEEVDLKGVSVEAFAELKEISANNASVRLHRARKAVAREVMAVCGACADHRCLDCTCQQRVRRSKV